MTRQYNIFEDVQWEWVKWMWEKRLRWLQGKWSSSRRRMMWQIGYLPVHVGEIPSSLCYDLPGIISCSTFDTDLWTCAQCYCSWCAKVERRRPSAKWSNAVWMARRWWTELVQYRRQSLFESVMVAALATSRLTAPIMALYNRHTKQLPIEPLCSAGNCHCLRAQKLVAARRSTAKPSIC